MVVDDAMSESRVRKRAADTPDRASSKCRYTGDNTRAVTRSFRPSGLHDFRPIPSAHHDALRSNRGAPQLTADRTHERPQDARPIRRSALAGRSSGDGVRCLSTLWPRFPPVTQPRPNIRLTHSVTWERSSSPATQRARRSIAFPPPMNEPSIGVCDLRASDRGQLPLRPRQEQRRADGDHVRPVRRRPARRVRQCAERRPGRRSAPVPALTAGSVQVYCRLREPPQEPVSSGSAVLRTGSGRRYARSEHPSMSAR